MRRSAAGNVVDLYWGDRNIRFHICDPLAHSDRADELTGQADHDPPPASCADGEDRLRPRADQEAVRVAGVRRKLVAKGLERVQRGYPLTSKETWPEPGS